MAYFFLTTVQPFVLFCLITDTIWVMVYVVINICQLDLTIILSILMDSMVKLKNEVFVQLNFDHILCLLFSGVGFATFCDGLKLESLFLVLSFYYVS